MKTERIYVTELDWIAAQDNYVELHLGRRTVLVRESLNEFARKLPRRKFARVHRSTIVNLSRIRTLEPCGHGEAEIVLLDGTRLRVSRARRSALMDP